MSHITCTTTVASTQSKRAFAQDAYDQGGIDYYEYEQREDRDGSYEDYSEDEFDPRKKGSIQPKKEVMKRGRKRKIPQEIEPAKKREPTQSKKPRKPVPEGYNTGVYTELEEKKFLEGLDLFGRDWAKLQEHVATRDANSIRSHAQKHFIKMFRDNIPLSAKIKETGEGYTLSGNPLDPNSSAARPYLKSMAKDNAKKSDAYKADTKKVDDVSKENDIQKEDEITKKETVEKNEEVIKEDKIEKKEKSLDEGDAVEKEEQKIEERDTIEKEDVIMKEQTEKEDGAINERQAKKEDEVSKENEDEKEDKDTKENQVEKEEVQKVKEVEKEENLQKTDEDGMTVSMEKQTEKLSIIENSIIPPW
ncbi:hypothetical protein CU098_010939 [Rhizopus stolonifer]|uniref:Uncharacterized protein n=1 Tax=Rhizopus stolonifer TaxID=4846 RepID=A0A367KMT7_RHIST|nr:hypothetical protein CU098_010939 [Rhizopus stolonifer]